ncbi:hypothetical protein FG05_35339 [Fusarium graminearum]|nr:hypothetical protein FG05_35339 [Fusarium graminearum]
MCHIPNTKAILARWSLSSVTQLAPTQPHRKTTTK